MSRLLVRIGRPDGAALAKALEEASSAGPTYDFVGATVDAGTISRHPVREHRRDLGRGDEVFASAVAGMRRWAQHHGILARVHPADAPLRVGTSVIVVLPAGPVAVLAPCRIIHVVDDERRFGFAYGSLPGHPATGEEAFLLDHLADGTVRFTIRVSSRPATPLLRLVAPVVVLGQRIAIARYLGALQASVAATDRR